MRTVNRALRDDAEIPDELAAQEVDILIRQANERPRPSHPTGH